MKIAYDIRGQFPEEINERFAESITYFLNRDLIIAYDSRESSKTLAESVVKINSALGNKNYYIGNSTTPFANFSSFILGKTLVMITASHLSNEYNGFKIADNGFSWSEEDYLDMINTIKNPSFQEKFSDFIKKMKKDKEEYKQIIDIRKDILNEYRKWLKLDDRVCYQIKEIEIKNEGNNPGFKLLKELGFKVIKNYTGEDDKLIPAFDSDCDRFYLFKGNKKLKNDLVALAIFKIVNEKKTIKKVVFNVGSTVLSYKIFKDIDWEMSKTGRNNIIEAMKDSDFAFEYSGHIYFKENINGKDYYLDDGIKALFEFFKNKEKFIQYYKELESKTNISEEYRITSTLDKFDRLIDYFKKRSLRIIDIDGYRFEFGRDLADSHEYTNSDSIADSIEGFLLIRKSNTEDKVSIRFEHKNKKIFEAIKERVEEYLSNMKSKE